VLVATRFVPVVSAYLLIDVYWPSALNAKFTRFAATVFPPVCCACVSLVRRFSES